MVAETVVPSKRAPIGRPAINFLRVLLGHVKSDFFDRFVEDGALNLDGALALAAFARLGSDMSGSNWASSYFTPVALNWLLEKRVARLNDLESLGHPCGGRLDRLLGLTKDQFPPRNDQLQPALEAREVSLFQVKNAGPIMRSLDELMRFKMGQYDQAKKYLLEHQIGLGLAHAHDVLKDFFVQATYGERLRTFLPVPDVLGLSVFTLVEYRVFQDENDKTGMPTLAWMETQIVSVNARGDSRNRVRLLVHKELDCLVPERSFLAVGGVRWFGE